MLKQSIIPFWKRANILLDYNRVFFATSISYRKWIQGLYTLCKIICPTDTCVILTQNWKGLSGHHRVEKIIFVTFSLPTSQNQWLGDLIRRHISCQICDWQNIATIIVTRVQITNVNMWQMSKFRSKVHVAWCLMDIW